MQIDTCHGLPRQAKFKMIKAYSILPALDLRFSFFILQFAFFNF